MRDKCMSLADMALAYPLVHRYKDRGVRHRVDGSCQIFTASLGNPRIAIIHAPASARDIAAVLFP